MYQAERCAMNCSIRNKRLDRIRAPLHYIDSFYTSFYKRSIIVDREFRSKNYILFNGVWHRELPMLMFKAANL